jgi:hypothetical protein
MVRPLRIWRILLGVVLALWGVLADVHPAASRASGPMILLAAVGVGVWLVRSGLAEAIERTGG